MDYKLSYYEKDFDFDNIDHFVNDSSSINGAVSRNSAADFEYRKAIPVQENS